MDGADNPTNDHTRRDVLRSAGLLTGAGLTGLGGVAPLEGGPLAPPIGQPTSPPACGDGDTTPPRPGPALLYDDNPTPPQLENTGGWSADPLMVSGTEGYADGEYRYQDYVYDDHGADTSPTGTPPEPEPETTAANFSAPTGDVVYPTDRTDHLDNAADLLEFRCRPVGGDGAEPPGVAYRFTMNTMVEPATAAVALGIVTDSEGAADWGYGLGDLGVPADHVLVVAGETAELDGSTEAVRSVSVDTARNQLEVVVDLDPGRETWDHHCVTGLWDPDAGDGIGSFRQIANQPTAEQPGGANGQDVPPVFNVAFRFDEPFGAANLQTERVREQAEEAREQLGSRTVGYGSRWDHAQANALAERDISRFGAAIDFARLQDGVTERRVPESGYMSRLYASGFDLGTTDRFDHGEGVDAEDNVFLGRVQPYTVYVPESYDGSPTPLLLLMHSLGGSSTQYATFSPDILRELGEGNDTIVVTPEGRGPSGWYQQEAEIDVFEAWRDLRNRYAVDDNRVSLSGYSMGGYGTFKLGAQYPDLFAKGFAVVGPAGEDPASGPSNGMLDTGSDYSADPENTMRVLDNLRHLPLLLWNGTNDELVPFPGVVNFQRQLRGLGYRHELDAFPGYDHFLFALRDDWGPGAEFLADDRLGAPTVTRNPARVTYRTVPDFDHDLGGNAPALVHDGAYWVQAIEPRGDGDAAEGLVDAVSYADGYGEPVAEDFREPGTEPAPHTKQGTRWRAPLEASPARNALAVTLEGVDSATVYVEAAGLDPTRRLAVTVESDGPATLVLKGSFGAREVQVGAGTTETTVTLCGGE